MEIRTTRRALITAGMLAALGWVRRPSMAALSSLTLDADRSRGGRSADPGHVLVTIFLRGGVDGLSVAAPYLEDDYYRLRPTLALNRPGDARARPQDRMIDLDGHFGLHPALAPLLPIYKEGELALVHACGSGDETRSHFEAMATMERGLRADTNGMASGWLARHLNALDNQSGAISSAAPLRAVAIGDTLPQSLAGATGVTVMQRVSDLDFDPHFGSHNAEIERALNVMYGHNGAVERSGRESLKLLRTLSTLSPASAAPHNGAVYPKDDIGVGLQQVAALMRTGIGLEVACLDHMGYDTHVAQGSSNGLLAGRLSFLARAIAAFRTDLGADLWSRTTVVVQSEFGRRVEENSGLGTDHGRGSVMMALGGSGVQGGKVWGDWPTLAADKLDGPGDLRVTTDYRNVLSEILAKRCGQKAPLQSVFPGLDYRPLGIIHA